MASSCSKWQWPPYESELRSHFDDRRETFQAIGREMTADGLVELTPSHLDGTERKRRIANQPTLTDAQRAKYRSILGERTSYIFQKRDNSFSINVYVSSAQGKQISFWYVNEPLWPEAPMCNSPAAKSLKCGRCVEGLEESWYMAWSWSPSDRQEFDETCSYLEEESTSE